MLVKGLDQYATIFKYRSSQHLASTDKELWQGQSLRQSLKYAWIPLIDFILDHKIFKYTRNWFHWCLFPWTCTPVVFSGFISYLSKISKISKIILCGIFNLKIKVLVCHMTFLLNRVLVGFIHIYYNIVTW